MGGRFFWSSVSDLTGRKAIYCVFFLLGAVLYALDPRRPRSIHSVTLLRRSSRPSSSRCTAAASRRSPPTSATCSAPCTSGAIHGRLITAWSMAAVLGPQLVNYISTYQIEHGVPKAEAYNLTMYLMAGLLLVGLVCNLLVRPVDERHHDEEPASPELSAGAGLIGGRTRTGSEPWTAASRGHRR